MKNTSITGKIYHVITNRGAFMYSDYTQARNKSWEILIKSGISKLPVSLKAISRYLNVSIIPYSILGNDIFNEKISSGDGFTTSLSDGKKLIFINDKKNHKRMRFTLAHELGHVALKHKLNPVAHRNIEFDKKRTVNEMQANIFARDVLMPACVLAKLNVSTANEISQLCDVSITSASIRMKRMQILYQRNKFGLHPLEREVLENFKLFISEKNKNNRSLLP